MCTKFNFVFTMGYYYRSCDLTCRVYNTPPPTSLICENTVKIIFCTQNVGRTFMEEVVH